MSDVGLKDDKAKPRMDLIEPLFLDGLAAVLTFGAEKYAPHNWRKGLSYTRVIGAMMRHTNAIARGEDHDPETGLLHAYHVTCCAMFLSWYQETRRVELDDRITSNTAVETPPPIKGTALTENESNTKNGIHNDAPSNSFARNTSCIDGVCRSLAENAYINT